MKTSSPAAGSKSLRSFPITSLRLDSDLDFDQEPGYYKDSYYPDFDPLPGETPVAFNLRYEFTCAGYRVRSIEEVKTHPVIIVRAVSKDAKLFPDPRLFFRHIQDLLRGVGFRVRRDEMTVSQSGERILIAFQTGGPPANFEEILREPQDDLIDDADMFP